MSKSVEALFRCAPPDATHYAAYCHYKKVNDVWMVHIGGDEWDKSSSMYNGDIKPADIVRRPQPKPWSGPEDGLPPVGSRVIVHECTHYHAKRFNGQLVRIVAHDEGKYAVFAADNFEYHALVAEKFKLPPTAADIAAELRETAIRELMDIAQVDCRVTAARLVDAGFKR